QQEIERNAATDAGLTYDWPMFRGGPSRSVVVSGSAPYLQERRWQASTIPDRSPTTKQWLTDALKQRREEDRGPRAFFPVGGGAKLIYRSYEGAHAVDVKTGETLWTSRAVNSLDGIIGNTGTGPEKRLRVSEWYTLYKQGNYPILFENSA